jgi:hypothetical protein
MANFPPTAEQQNIIDAFLTGGDMVIEAGAGTGKTSTLRLLAEAAPERKALYLAYNKAIQVEADGTFPSNVNCRTAHSLAYGPVGSKFRARLNGPRVTSKQMVATLGIPYVGFSAGEVQLQPWQCASLVMQGIGRFCNSADTEVSKFHMPRLEGAEEVQSDLDAFLLPFARKAWENLTDPKATGLRFTHDMYLKIWALSNPVLKFEVIFFDEAQDANPCIAGIVAAQANAQTVMVGDRNQAIYGWRGAVDAMSTFEGTVLPLSQSFRFGSAVADEANKFLRLLGSDLVLKGFDKIESTVEILADPDAILCRTNAGVIQAAMHAQAEGKNVAIVGGAAEIKKFAQGAIDLMGGRKANHPDLTAFSDWFEVIKYSQSDEGKDLRVMVKLIEEHGPQTIIEVADNSVNEKDADLVVSTAHKAKGLEWDRVRIAPDFKMPEEGSEPSRPEMMLMYVAVTRAQKVLDRSGVAWIDLFIGEAVA